MSSVNSPVTPNQASAAEKINKQNLARTTTAPTSFGTPPISAEINRQLSASPSLTSAPVSAVTAYLKHLLGLNAKTTKRSLSEEAECGSPESLSEWLRQGSNPNEIDGYGYTPLINACLRGCYKSVKILIQNGADVNMKAMHGYFPLHVAAQVSFFFSC